MQIEYLEVLADEIIDLHSEDTEDTLLEISKEDQRMRSEMEARKRLDIDIYIYSIPIRLDIG